MPSVRIKVIIPQKALFNSGKFIAALKTHLRQKTDPDLKRFFKGTTEGWQKQPEFRAHHFETAQQIGVRVYTSDDIYGLVNAGSPPHLILPRNRGFLRFQPGYSSATKPGSLRSRAYRRTGKTVKRGSVKHPGFAARKFNKQIKDAYTPTFENDVDKLVSKGLP